MPSLKVSHCLICDTIRPELHNKITILGFLGITPDIEIQLQDLNLPVDELSFVFMGSVNGSAGQTDLVFELFDANDARIFSTSQQHEMKPAARSNIIFDIRFLKFPRAGRYKVRLRVDSKPVYDTEFAISQAPESPVLN
jgi:hypothetical protein